MRSTSESCTSTPSVAPTNCSTSARTFSVLPSASMPAALRIVSAIGHHGFASP